jgi:hypothetical protein
VKTGNGKRETGNDEPGIGNRGSMVPRRISEIRTFFGKSGVAAVKRIFSHSGLPGTLSFVSRFPFPVSRSRVP